jgi:hypothetical protein
MKTVIRMERKLPHVVSGSSLVVTANVVPSSLILSTLMMEAMRSSQTSFLQEPHGVNIPEDDILHSHGSEKLKFYITYFHNFSIRRIFS